MKIALLSSYRKNDGVARYIYNLKAELHRRRNLTVDSYESRSTSSFIKNIAIFGLDNLRRDFSKYNLIHNTYFNFIFNSSIKSPIITTVYDIREITSPPNYIVKMIGLKILRSDYIIAISNQTKNEIINLGYDKKRIFVINLGLDERFLKGKKVKTVNKKFVIGYLGSFEQNKNVLSLTKVANRLDKNEFMFNIYGKGSEESKLKKVIIENALDNMILKGFAPENRITNIYDTFDVFVFPSVYEGFGMPIIEAQSRGLPVIIYKYAKIPKECKKHCFEAYDEQHMASIIEDIKRNGYNVKKQQKAMKYARSFTWKKCAKKTLEIYKRIAQN